MAFFFFVGKFQTKVSRVAQNDERSRVQKLRLLFFNLLSGVSNFSHYFNASWILFIPYYAHIGIFKYFADTWSLVVGIIFLQKWSTFFIFKSKLFTLFELNSDSFKKCQFNSKEFIKVKLLRWIWPEGWKHCH